MKSSLKIKIHLKANKPSIKNEYYIRGMHQLQATASQWKNAYFEDRLHDSSLVQ
jgi:hypothetical protein